MACHRRNLPNRTGDASSADEATDPRRDNAWLPGAATGECGNSPDLIQIARMSPRAAGAWSVTPMGGLLALAAEAEAGRGGVFRALVLVDITPRYRAAGVEDAFSSSCAPYPDIRFADLDEAAAAIPESCHPASRSTPNLPNTMQKKKKKKARDGRCAGTGISACSISSLEPWQQQRPAILLITAGTRFAIPI
jgi:hypothetical protein